MNIDISDDKAMLMRKLAIYEFGCRNILLPISEKVICYSEIVSQTSY